MSFFLRRDDEEDVDVSTGSTANFLRGLEVLFSCSLSLLLLVLVSIGSGANRRFGFESVSSFFLARSLLLVVFVSIGSTANFLLGRAGLSSSLGGSDLVLRDVVSMGSGANLRFGEVVLPFACSCLLLLEEVSTGSGANLRLGFGGVACCGVVASHSFLSSGCLAGLTPFTEGSSSAMCVSASPASSTCVIATLWSTSVDVGVGEDAMIAMEAVVDSEMPEEADEAFERSGSSFLLLREVISMGSARNLRLGGVVEVMARVTVNTG